jgi:uncharacterized membrane-anchored protein
MSPRRVRGVLSERRRLVAFLLLVALQAAVVVGFVVREERHLAAGQEVVLRAAPVDPRDPLRGDFVILGYQIEGQPIPYSGTARPGDAIYVLLEQRGRYWEPVSAQPRLDRGEELPRGQALLRGRVSYVTGRRVVVEFPELHQYFVPQGSGILPGPPDVVLAVSRDGTARIKRLEIDGKPWP